MYKIVILGAGRHSQTFHLPSLARYVKRHPDEIELVALCDLNRELAGIAASTFGFSRVYTDFEAMLEQEKPDGCIAITPFKVTAQIATRIIRLGIPLLMEKPLGATLEEAEKVCDMVEKYKAQVMVSMNRRFDPALSAGLAWKGDRPFEYLRGTMMRYNRKQTDFFEETAIHALDAMRDIGGDIRHYSIIMHRIAEVRSFVVKFVFENEAVGILEVFPNSGNTAEYYDILGSDYRILIRVGEKDAGKVSCWENNQLAMDDEPTKGLPNFIKNGTYAETKAFIAALQRKHCFSPTPHDVLQSTRLCYRISRKIQII